MDIKNYPDIYDFACKGTAYFHVSQVFKSDPKEAIAWYQVEELFCGNKLMLTMLVDNLLSAKQWKKWCAVGQHIWNKYDLGSSKYPSAALRDLANRCKNQNQDEMAAKL